MKANMTKTLLIPEHLKSIPNWIVWRLEDREGDPKPAKVPYTPVASTSRLASSTDPQTWGTFGAALTVYELNGYSGIGFVLAPENGLVFIDLDECRNPDTGLIDKWAQRIIDLLNSYTELSPSGTGVHIFIKGTLPLHGRRRGHIEMYSDKRYATVTGEHVEGTPLTIEERGAEIASLHVEVFGEARVPTVADYVKTGHSLSDSEIVALASKAGNGAKFRDLWRGQWDAYYPSESEADAGLLGILAFYTQDYNQLDRLMRDSGLLYTPPGTQRLVSRKATGTNGAHPEPEPEQEPAEGIPPQPHKWEPIPISECGYGEPIDWLWQSCLAPGFITSFAAEWKSGKTTLLAHMLRTAGLGIEEFGGLPLRQMKTLYITEEHASLWAERRDELGLRDNLYIISRPFAGKPTYADWVTLVMHAVDMVKARGFDLVIVDTVFNLWSVVNENDNAEVISALQPFRALSQVDAAVLLVTHPGKSDAGRGKSTRGAGGWGGFVDIIMEMRRFSEDVTDTRRMINTSGRFKDMIPEIVLDYDVTSNTYHSAGTKASVHQQERRRAILSQLPENAPGREAKDIHADWSSNARRPSLRTLRYELKEMISEGTTTTTGGTSPNDPTKYYRKEAHRLVFAD
jgi:hypothetical protein